MKHPLNYTHEGLPESDLRDFLSKNLEKACAAGAQTFDGGEEIIKRHIAEMEKKLEATKVASGILAMAKLKGWEFVDNSDHVQFEKDKWFMFLGTKEELALKFPELVRDED